MGLYHPIISFFANNHHIIMSHYKNFHVWVQFIKNYHFDWCHMSQLDTLFQFSSFWGEEEIMFSSSIIIVLLKHSRLFHILWISSQISDLLLTDPIHVHHPGWSSSTTLTSCLMGWGPFNEEIIILFIRVALFSDELISRKSRKGSLSWQFF